MNTVTIDNKTYHDIETFAKLNNLAVADVVKKSFNFFKEKFQTAKPQAKAINKYELPEHIEKLAGSLAGVEDSSDERLNYLLEKYK